MTQSQGPGDLGSALTEAVVETFEPSNSHSCIKLENNLKSA